MTSEDCFKLALAANIIGVVEMLKSCTKEKSFQDNQLNRLRDAANRFEQTIPGIPPEEMMESSARYYNDMERAVNRLIRSLNPTRIGRDAKGRWCRV